MSDFLREIDARHLLDGNHYPHELPEEKDRIDLALDSARRRIIDFLEAHTAEKDPLMEEVRSSTRMKALRSAFDFVLSPGGLLVDLATLNGKQRTDLINHELGHLMIAAFSESIDPNEVKVSKFQNFSVMLGKPQGYVSYKYKTSSPESDI